MRVAIRWSLTFLLVACGQTVLEPTASTVSPAARHAPTASMAVGSDPAPAPTPRLSAAQTPLLTPGQTCRPPDPETVMPTACRDGVTMTAAFRSVPEVAEGMGVAPELPLDVALTGLLPGEVLTVRAVGTYRILVLGCGRRPSVCSAGTEDLGGRLTLCQPVYAEHAAGSSSASVPVVAAADGTAVLAVRLVVSQTRRSCPADPSLPWYQRSAMWTVTVTESAHRLSITTPPWIIGP